MLAFSRRLRSLPEKKLNKKARKKKRMHISGGAESGGCMTKQTMPPTQTRTQNPRPPTDRVSEG